MIIDANLQFDAGVEHLTAGKSENIADIKALRDLGNGTNLYLVVVATIALAGASAVTVNLETDDASGMASPTKAQEIGTFAAAAPVGTKIFAKLDPGKIDEQFLQLAYAFSGADNTTGTFNAFITNSIDNTVDYPIGYTI